MLSMIGHPSGGKPLMVDVRQSGSGPVLPPATRVIVVYVDELPLLKRLVAHATGVLLRSQQAVELL
jgi:hypothetical protein